MTRLLHLRRLSGQSQTYVSMKCRIDRGDLSLLERGEKTPTAGQQAKLRSHFDVPEGIDLSGEPNVDAVRRAILEGA